MHLVAWNSSGNMAILWKSEVETPIFASRWKGSWHGSEIQWKSYFPERRFSEVAFHHPSEKKVPFHGAPASRKEVEKLTRTSTDYRFLTRNLMFWTKNGHIFHILAAYQCHLKFLVSNYWFARSNVLRKCKSLWKIRRSTFMKHLSFQLK